MREMRALANGVIHARVKRFAGLLILVFALGLAEDSRGATYQWSAGGAEDTRWSSSSNWSLGGVPGFAAGDIFDLSSLSPTGIASSTMDTAQTLGAISVGVGTKGAAGSWDLLLNANLTLSVAGGTAVITQTINSNGDRFGGEGSILLSSSLSLRNASAKSLSISNSFAAASLGNKTITNEGTGAGDVALSGRISNGSGMVAVIQNSSTSSLTLSGSNSFSGGTTLNAGILQVDNNWGLGSGPLTLTSGTLLSLCNLANPINIKGNIALGNASQSGTLSLRGNADFGSNQRTLTINGSVALLGSLSGSGFLKAGEGTLILLGTSEFTNPVNVSQGVLNVQVPQGLGISGDVKIASGGSLQVQGGISITKLVSLAGIGATRATGALENVSGTNTIQNSLQLISDTTIASDAGLLSLAASEYILGQTSALTLAGAGNGEIANAMGTTVSTLIKKGSGTWKVTGINSFTGATIIQGGILNPSTLANINIASGIGKGSLTGSAADLVLDGGTLQYTGKSAAATNRPFTLTPSGGALDASGSLSGSVTSGTSGSQTLALAGSGTGPLGGVLSGNIGNGAGTNVTAVAKIGNGTWTLSGSNTYSGGTAIASGTLKLAHASALGAAAGALSIQAGTLDLNANNASIGNLSGSSQALITSGIAGSSTLSVNSANSSTYSGAINNGAGTISLRKSGTGTLALAGVSNYTGTTSIAAGKVIVSGSLSATQALAVSGALTVNGATNLKAPVLVGPGASLGGIGAVGPVILSQGSGAAGSQGGGLLAPGDDGSGQLTVASLSGTTGAMLSLKLNSPGSANSGQVNLSGSGSSLGSMTLTLSNPNFQPGDLFFILINYGHGAIVGNFTSDLGVPLLANGDSYLIGGQSYKISYTANYNAGSFMEPGAFDVALLAVPEPTYLAQTGLGCLLLLCYKPRRCATSGRAGIAGGIALDSGMVRFPDFAQRSCYRFGASHRSINETLSPLRTAYSSTWSRSIRPTPKYFDSGWEK